MAFLQRVTVLSVLIIFFGLLAVFWPLEKQKNSLPSPRPVEIQIAPGMVQAMDVFSPEQLDEDEKARLPYFSWPKLRAFEKGDETRPVYLVDCQVINEAPGYFLKGIPKEVPDTPNIIETTLKKLLEYHYGGFPDPTDIQEVTALTGVKFKHKDIGLNGVLLKTDGTLVVNFYDSVRAYGGGSSRVGCMRFAVDLTAKQFPGVKRVEMCIDRYSTSLNDCRYDFQP